MLLFGLRQVAAARPTHAARAPLALPIAAVDWPTPEAPSAQLGFFLRKLRLGFVEVSPARGKLSHFFLQLLQSSLRSRRAARSGRAPSQFLADDNQAADRPNRVPLLAAKARLRRLPQFGPADFQFAGPLTQRFGLLFQFGALRLQPRFPVGNFCFRPFELGQPIFGPRLVGNELLDIAIKLRLSPVDLAMPRFDRGLSRLQPVVAFVPGGPIVVERFEPSLANWLRILPARPRELASGSRARRAILRELVSARWRELRQSLLFPTIPVRAERPPRLALRVLVAARPAIAARSAISLRGRLLAKPTRPCRRSNSLCSDCNRSASWAACSRS